MRKKNLLQGAESLESITEMQLSFANKPKPVNKVKPVYLSTNASNLSSLLQEQDDQNLRFYRRAVIEKITGSKQRISTMRQTKSTLPKMNESFQSLN